MAKRKVNELAALPKKAPKSLEAVPFETLCAYVFRSGSSFRIDGDGLEITIGAGSPAWLADLLNAHRGRLLQLARCQELDAHIEYRLRQLGPPYTMTFIRSGHAYLSTQVAKFVKLSGSEIGYDDPGNIFAWNCIESYRDQLAAFSNL